MKLSISTLNEGENALEFNSIRDSWLKNLISRIEREGGFHFETPLGLDLRLTKLEPDYYLRGKMNYCIAVPCARCAESFKMPVDQAFELALSHVKSAEAGSEKISEESEELDINFFSGNEIDLEPMVEEQFQLSLPYKALCSNNCRGVCQKCGKNLNQGNCDCKSDSETNPFSILKQIKH
jgi:uncharacterized protein